MTKRNNIKITDFTLLNDNILVKEVEIKEKDGVLTADSYDSKPELGKVFSVGQGRVLESGELVPLGIKVRDIIYFNPYTSTKFNIDGEDWYIVKEEDVVGYLR